MDDEMLDYLKQLRARYMQFWPLTDLLEKMMADIAQIQADIAALKDAEAAAADELERLANLLTSMQAGTVTQAQLDEIHDSLQSVTTQLTAATQAAMASEPPHAEQTG
jgi:multidrug resistance efflux pump